MSSKICDLRRSESLQVRFPRTLTDSLCGQILDKFWVHAAVWPYTGGRNRRYNVVTYVRNVVQHADLRIENEKSGAHRPLLNTDESHQSVSPDGPVDVWIFYGKNTNVRSAVHTMSTVQDLYDYISFKRNLHDIVNRCRQKDIRFVSVIFDGHADDWRDCGRNLISCISTDSTSPSVRFSHDISRDLEQCISSSLQRDYSARAIQKRIHLAVSRDTPSPPFQCGQWSVRDDLCHLVCFGWPERNQRLRFCQHVDVFLSRNVVRHPAPLSHLFTRSCPLLVAFAAPLLFRAGSVGFSQQDSLGCCRLFVAMDVSSASTDSSDIFLIENARRLKCMERLLIPDLSLVKLTSSTRRWIAEERETSTRSPSADLRRSVNFIEELQCAQHCRRSFFPCPRKMTLMRTKSGQ